MKPHHTSRQACMRQITDCKASDDDGLKGSVLPSNLREIAALRRTRDVSQFCGAMIDPGAAPVVREGGIRFDPDVLYRDLLQSGAGKEFGVPEFFPAVE